MKRFYVHMVIRTRWTNSTHQTETECAGTLRNADGKQKKSRGPKSAALFFANPEKD